MNRDVVGAIAEVATNAATTSVRLAGKLGTISSSAQVTNTSIHASGAEMPLLETTVATLTTLVWL